MNLYERILKLKQATAGLTTNPVLDAFNIEECKILDASSDLFIQEKIRKCLGYLKDVTIDFTPGYKSAYEEYNEAIIYLDLSAKYNVSRISEASTKTPDFSLSYPGDFAFDIFAEVKALSFVDGNLNYHEAQKSSFDAQVSIEEQLQKGNMVTFGESVVSPFSKAGKLPSTRQVIEVFIDKINNNIKAGQYVLGDTVLIVDIKQLLLPSRWYESVVANYIIELPKAVASGVLWHVAFGKAGDTIFQPLSYEGDPNVDSELTRNGILIDNNFITALIVVAYENFQDRKYVGFYRYKDEDNQSANFVTSFCELYNDDKNSGAWKILSGKY